MFINYLNFRFTKSSLETSNYGNQSLQPVDKLIEQTKSFTRYSISITKGD
jgi:hypothetical protein